MMMSRDEQIFGISNKILVARFENTVAGFAVLEPMMCRLLEAKHSKMVSHRDHEPDPCV